MVEEASEIEAESDEEQAEQDQEEQEHEEDLFAGKAVGFPIFAKQMVKDCLNGLKPGACTD